MKNIFSEFNKKSVSNYTKILIFVALTIFFYSPFFSEKTFASTSTQLTEGSNVWMWENTNYGIYANTTVYGGAKKPTYSDLEASGLIYKPTSTITINRIDASFASACSSTVIGIYSSATSSGGFVQIATSTNSYEAPYAEVLKAKSFTFASTTLVSSTYYYIGIKWGGIGTCDSRASSGEITWSARDDDVSGQASSTFGPTYLGIYPYAYILRNNGDWTDYIQAPLTMDHLKFRMFGEFRDDRVVTSTSPTAEFKFPINGTGSLDFANWVVQTHNLDATVAKISIDYKAIDGSAFYNDTFNVGQAGEIVDFYGAISKNQFLCRIGSSTIQASVSLLDENNDTIYTSAEITFYINNTFPFPTIDTHMAGPFGNTFCGEAYPTSTDTYKELFGFQDTALDFLVTQWTNFKGTFPFSLVLNFASTTEDALKNASTSAKYDLIWNTSFMGKNITINLVTSSTLSFVVGSSTKDKILVYEGRIFWLLGLAKILGMVL